MSGSRRAADLNRWSKPCSGTKTSEKQASWVCSTTMSSGARLWMRTRAASSMNFPAGIGFAESVIRMVSIAARILGDYFKVVYDRHQNANLQNNVVLDGSGDT